MNVVDPHAPGGEKHFDRASNKRKYDEMAVGPCSTVTALDQSFPSLPFFLLPGLQGGDSGNYTLETAKSRLHLFLQQTRQPKDMQIRPVGPDHNRFDHLSDQ